MISFLTGLAIVACNFIMFLGTSQIRKGIAPDRWKSYYERTTLTQRTVVAGLINMMLIGFFTWAFQADPAVASVVQSLMGALVVLGMAVTLGRKRLTPAMILAGLLVGVSSAWLGWAITQAQ